MANILQKMVSLINQLGVINEMEEVSRGTIKEEYEEVAREMIKHENDLIKARMGWMTAIQALLFSTLGLTVIIENDSKGIVDPNTFIFMISVLGFFVSVLTVWGVRNALYAIHRLLDWWDKNKPDGYNGPDIIGLRGREEREKDKQVENKQVCARFKKIFYKLFTPWLFIPTSFSIAWICIIVLISKNIF